ncbi:MAG: beta strand repeat-containing protein [Pirellulaceae bacterium]
MALPSQLTAQDFTWTGGGDGTSWNQDENWDESGFPGISDTAIFDQNAQVTSGSAGTLNLGTGVTLTTDLNSKISIGSIVFNQGVFTFANDETDNGGSVDTALSVAGGTVASLQGGGEVVFNGFETGFRGGGTLTNVDNTIRGVGTIDLNVVNQWLIRAEGGTLFVFDSITNDPGGIVRIAADGVLDAGLTGGSITGGTLDGVAGGQLQTMTLNDLTMMGTITQMLNEKTTLAGTIANQGVFTFANDETTDGGSVDTALSVAGGTVASLQGGGEVVFNGFETGFRGGGTLTNVDNTIRGVGTIDLDVFNQWLIRAEGGTLFVDNSITNDSGGIVRIAADGVLDAGLTGGSITGGVLDVVAGGQLQSFTLRDLTITGNATQALNTQTRLEGTISNQGVYTFVNDETNDGGGVDTALSVAGPVGLEGGGEVIFNGFETGFRGGGTLTNVDNTISGSGTIGLDFVNGGILSPGDSAGLITFEDSVTLLSTSELQIEIGGLLQSDEYDFVDILSSVELDGQLSVSLISPFGDLIEQSDTFTILESTALNGVFDNVANGGTLLTQNGTFSFQVNYGAGSLFDERFVVLSNSSAVPEPSVFLVIGFLLAAANGLGCQRRHPGL